MTKKLTTFAALLAAMMFVSNAGARDQADAAGTGQANDDADVASPDAAGAADAAAAEPAAARQGQAGQSGQISEKDRRFVMKAASSGMFEVASSKLAQQQAQSQEVKQFAQQMIADHTKANQQLMQLAQRKGIELPKDMLPVHKACLQELQQLKGQEFERGYVIDQVAEHTKAVLKFTDASTQLQDSELKQFASQTLPKLRMHLSHAQQIAGMDEATTAGSRESGAGAGATDQTNTPAGGDRETSGSEAGSQSTTPDAGSDAGSDAGGADGAAADEGASNRRSQ